MLCPDSIPIVDGRLDYVPPEAGTIPKERRRRPKSSKPLSGTNEQRNPKKRGRTKGSKNKKTLEREAILAAQGQAQKPKRGRGRPKGSKNIKTLEREALAAQSADLTKRRPVRPKGSKNKKTLEREAAQNQ